MMHFIQVGKDARDYMIEKLGLIAKAVGSTLGPGGMPFAYSKIGPDMRLQATFSKDGLTVVRSLGFPGDPAGDAILQYAKQAAAHSVLASGDGTTSTIILANAVANAVRNSDSKKPPQALAREIEKQASEAIRLIREESIPGNEVARLVALTSSNGDEELADITMEVISKSAAFGTVVPEKNPASKERYRIVTQDGYSHCSGYDYNNTLAVSASQNAASNAPIDWEKPSVAVFNGNLMVSEQLDPIVKAWNENLKDGNVSNLVIVAYDISDKISTDLLVLNRRIANQGVAVFIVKPRLSSEINSGLQVLRDIAAFTGVKDEKIIDGGNYRLVDKGFLGTCDKIRITPNNTIFMGRAEDHWVDKRVLQNQNIIADARSQHDKEATALRNAQLTEGLVRVVVGGGMMPDLQERADRLDDAVKATQSCLRNGALPGAGASYIRAGELAKVGPELSQALQVIHNTIMDNRGLNPIASFGKGETIRITEDGFVWGFAKDIKVLDAADTVCAVIKNGVDLGVKVATLGGYSFRMGEVGDESLEGV